MATPLAKNSDVFGSLVESADKSLWEHIPSQTSWWDRNGLLAMQSAARNSGSTYSYLEIGSYLGGSIQTHWPDPRCRQIYSIDPRPGLTADVRGAQHYGEETSEMMLERLRKIHPSPHAKIQCIDADASTIDPKLITDRPILCFIDGEHTPKAAKSDYTFCRKVLAPNGAILFHDLNLIYEGLAWIIQDLRAEKVTFRSYNLSNMFVIEFGDCRFHQSPQVQNMLLAQPEGTLQMLRDVEIYRTFYRKPISRILRRLKLA